MIMQNITCATDLKQAIQSMEVEQAESEKLLKVQFRMTYESLKPVNLIRNTIKDIASEPELINNLIGTTLGLAGGYISKKIVVGSSHNIFRKLFGSLLEFGVVDMVARNPEALKSATQFIFNMFRKKDTNSE